LSQISIGPKNPGRSLLSTGPLLVAFLLFQRQFVQSFMRAGIH